MSHFATAEHEKERLQYFASPEGRDDLYQYNQKESRTVLEVSYVLTGDFLYAVLAIQKISVCKLYHLYDNRPLSLEFFSWLNSEIWFCATFRYWRIFPRCTCLLNGWCN